MLETLFVNAFFLFVFCCFVPLIILITNLSKEKSRNLLILSTSIAIVACISFTIQLDSIIFDLRLVAQIFGSLYTGPIGALILASVNIGYRSIFGGIGVLTTIVIASLHVVILIGIRTWYLKLSLHKKVIAGLVLGLCSAIVTNLIVSVVGGITLPTELLIYFPLLQMLILGMVIFIVETIKQLLIIQNKVFQAEKIETVSHLAASISHEVRNPLTVVRGFIQLLQESDLPSDKRKKFLNISIKELDRAEEVIQDYLTYAKPTSDGKQKKLNVKSEIKRTITILEALANMHSIQIQTHLQPLYVEGNQQQFQQSLINICKNSIEAMESQSMRTLNISCFLEDNKVVISIKDSGVGMDHEAIKRLGEPFYSLKGSRGTGLGTMVVYRCIEEMGGSIKVISEKGKGTDFLIYLPNATHID